MRYIIEHLEKKVYPWCFIEYEHISKIVGKERVIFTNSGDTRLKKFGNVIKQSVATLDLKKACVLDPKAEKTLEPGERFEYFIFGGILGDYPRRGRTTKLLSKKLKDAVLRNLGKKQMSTDTAVLVTKLISEGKRLEEITFKDDLEIELKNGRIRESTILPYRYVVLKGKPIVSKKLVNYLKKK